MLNGQNIKKPLTVIDPETEPIQIGQASANTKKKTLPSVKKTVGTNKKAPETLKKPTEVLKSIEIDHIANEPRERIRIKRLLPMAAHKSAMLPGNLKPKRDTYNVEEILDKRMIGRHFKYLIKWEGYPDEENSWEPKSNLPSQLVDEFEEKNKVLRTEKPVEVLDENKKDLSEGLNLGEEHQKLDQKGLIDVEKEVEKNETFKNNEHNVEGENLEQPEVIEEKGNKNQPMEIEEVEVKNDVLPIKKQLKKSHFIKKNKKNVTKPLEVEDEKENPTKSGKEALVINSDNEGPGSNRATKYGDFRLGDRFKQIKKLRYNKKMKTVYAVIEWKPRDDGFVPLTSKIDLNGLKSNIPNETINFLVNTLIEMKEKRKEAKNSDINGE